ncbi:MAG: DUF2281 domain-containing protein [Ignavibacteria bacterium]|jgi:hypothetical protein|nr:DUF2281 domain-containing protein [Ignavibacteria bacterium]
MNEEVLYDKIKHLSAENLQDVADFVDFIVNKDKMQNNLPKENLSFGYMKGMIEYSDDAFEPVDGKFVGCQQ